MLVEDKPKSQSSKNFLRENRKGVSKLNLKSRNSAGDILKKYSGKNTGKNILKNNVDEKFIQGKRLKRTYIQSGEAKSSYATTHLKSDARSKKLISGEKNQNFNRVASSSIYSTPTGIKRKSSFAALFGLGPSKSRRPNPVRSSVVRSQGRMSSMATSRGDSTNYRMDGRIESHTNQKSRNFRSNGTRRVGKTVSRLQNDKPTQRQTPKITNQKLSLAAVVVNPFKKSLRNFNNSKRITASDRQSQNRVSSKSAKTELNRGPHNSLISKRRKNQSSIKVASKKIDLKQSATKKVTGKIGIASPRHLNNGAPKRPNNSNKQEPKILKSPAVKNQRLRSRSKSKNTKVFGISYQTQLSLLVGVLTVFGLAMVLSASEVSALVASHSPWSLFIKQFSYIFMGWFALAYCALKVKISTVRKLTPLFFFATVVALVIIMVPGIGTSQYGSARWINLGAFTFQPSEMAKLATVLIGAYILDKRNKYINNFTNSTRPYLICAGIMGGLVVAQPDLGTTIIIASIFFTLLFVARVDTIIIYKLAAGAGAFGAIYALSATYRRNRLLSFINPMDQVRGPGYQVVQSLIGLHSGHIFGTGLGSSTIKWGFLPNDYTDFIFSIIGQELGLIGSLVVLCLFAYLSFLGIKVARNAKDNYQMLLAAGITAWLSFQAFINIGAATGGLPVTGIPLPLLSYGGTQVIISMAAIGILINIARQSKGNSGLKDSTQVTRKTKQGNEYLVKTLI